MWDHMIIRELMRGMIRRSSIGLFMFVNPNMTVTPTPVDVPVCMCDYTGGDVVHTGNTGRLDRVGWDTSKVLNVFEPTIVLT